MTVNLSADTVLPSTAVGQEPADRGRRSGSSAPWRLLMAVWKGLLGTALCQFPLTSIFVIGWTYRLMQRCVLKRWWKRSALRAEGVTFREFLDGDDATRVHTAFPNWLLRARGASASASTRRRPIRRTAALLFGSLWANAKIGLQGILNTWVLTLPACVLWLFAWYDGWNNSFNKGYEQAAVGPLTGLLGVALFIAAMLYVPMAQARQAATGSWRAFYQFRLVWRLVRLRPIRLLCVALLFTLVSLPLSVLRMLPAFFPQMFPGLESAGDAQIAEVLGRYFFWAGAAMFAGYVVVRLAAARAYAGAILLGVQKRWIAAADLSSTERSAIERLGLLDPQRFAKRPPHRAVRTAGWFWRNALLVVTALIWFTFVAQIFIGEFFNYHPVVGWLNQPLVQLPWLRYIPSHLIH